MIRTICPKKSWCTWSSMILSLADILITSIMCLNVLRFNLNRLVKINLTVITQSFCDKIAHSFFPSDYAFLRSSFMSVVGTIPLDRKIRSFSSKRCTKTSFSNSMISCTSFKIFLNSGLT